MNYLYTYILGSYYILRSVFRFSEYSSKYLLKNKWINISPNKLNKIEEVIYSSFHGTLVSSMASLSLTTPIFDKYNLFQITNIQNESNNQLQLFTSCFCLTYFVMDLFKCIYNKKYLFILHHIAAINLLMSGLHTYMYESEKNNGFYIMYFIFLLESNTVLLNSGFILKECNFHYSITCAAWIIHLILFVLFRLITIPQLIIIYYLQEGITLKTLLQLPNFILILSGSMYWSYRQLLGIQKYLKENSVL